MLATILMRFFPVAGHGVGARLHAGLINQHLGSRKDCPPPAPFLHAETKAMLLALEIAKQKEWRSLYGVVNCHFETPWKIKDLVRDIITFFCFVFLV